MMEIAIALNFFCDYEKKCQIDLSKNWKICLVMPDKIFIHFIVATSYVGNRNFLTYKNFVETETSKS